MRSEIYPNTYYNPTKLELSTIPNIEDVHIAFDLDSVLNDLGENLDSYLAQRIGITEEQVVGKNEDGTRSFQYRVPCGYPEDMGTMISEFINEFSDRLEPTPYMTDVIRHIYNVTGSPIVIVTARPITNMAVSYDWLKKHLPDYIPFVLIMVSGMQKEVVLNRLDIGCFIDDRHKTVARLMKHIDVSIRYRRPWNMGRYEPAGHFYVNDLRELIPFVNSIYGYRPMAWPHNIPYPDRLGEGETKYA